jgi:hypothetical protein
MYIADHRETEFFLEKLSNCTLREAFKILGCKRKTLSERERAFLVPRDGWNIFGRSDFYLQKISLPRHLPGDEVFLMENVVAAFCNGISRIDREARWIYAADHGSGSLRIIAGIGRGIMISRFLSKNTDVSEEISKTVMYLRRFGTEGDVKIFSPRDDIRIPAGASFERICLPASGRCGDLRKVMADFVRGGAGIKPVTIRGNHMRRFLNSEFLCCAPLAALAVLLGIDRGISENRRVISSLEKSVHAVSPGITLEITESNLAAAKRVVETIKNLHDPADLFLKASEIMSRHGLSAEHMSMEGENRLLIKTSPGKAALARLKIDGDAEVRVVSENEYEELGADGKTGVELCVVR